MHFSSNLPSLFIYQTGQYLYPISDQNGPKTISFGAMHTRAFVFKGVCDGRGGGEGGGVRPERDKMHNTSCKFKPKLPPLPTRGYPVDKCHPSSTN